MLEITIGDVDAFDGSKNEFVLIPGVPLQIEHSLSSLSKWEQKYEKPFLSSDKTQEEVLDYIRMMTLGKPLTEEILNKFTQENFNSVQEYIAAKMTATWFNDRPTNLNAPKKEIITSEIIYYWMVALQIPFECQNWHLNTLLTLIRVCNEKNQPEEKKKGFTRDALAERRALNEARKKQFNTNG